MKLQLPGSMSRRRSPSEVSLEFLGAAASGLSPAPNGVDNRTDAEAS